MTRILSFLRRGVGMNTNEQTYRPSGAMNILEVTHSAIDSRTGMMELMGGGTTLIAGRYRIRTRLSHHPWTNALQPPEGYASRFLPSSGCPSHPSDGEP